MQKGKAGAFPFFVAGSCAGFGEKPGISGGRRRGIPRKPLLRHIPGVLEPEAAGFTPVGEQDVFGANGARIAPHLIGGVLPERNPGSLALRQQPRPQPSPFGGAPDDDIGAITPGRIEGRQGVFDRNEAGRRADARDEPVDEVAANALLGRVDRRAATKSRGLRPRVPGTATASGSRSAATSRRWERATRCRAGARTTTRRRRWRP
jgi:hypothetical protein